MPKIRFSEHQNGYQDGNQTGQRRGLRSGQENEEVHIPGTQREKDDYFDLYRVDGRRNGCRRPSPGPKKKRNAGGGFQMWYLACLIAALGSFCVFMDSAVVSFNGIPVSLSGISILASATNLPPSVPGYVLYISLIPLLSAGISVTFAIMKEEAFDKASLVMIALTVFAIAVLFYWSDALMKYGNWSMSYSPGTGVIVEIGCCIALLIVIVCQRIICRGLLQEMSFIRRR